MSNVGKQTKKTGSKFGGDWTVDKLEIIEKYFNAYTKIMENQNWAKTVYIDAFTGSGEIDLPDTTKIKGSPLIALQYDFSKYYFIDMDEKRIKKLETNIKSQYPQKIKNVEFIKGDCNVELPKVFETLSKDKSTRGVLFLDPYAMELKWNTLEQAKKTKLDIFYWFPIMAVNRLLFKDKTKFIDSVLVKKLNTQFGEENWFG